MFSHFIHHVGAQARLSNLLEQDIGFYPINHLSTFRTWGENTVAEARSLH